MKQKSAASEFTPPRQWLLPKIVRHLSHSCGKSDVLFYFSLAWWLYQLIALPLVNQGPARASSALFGQQPDQGLTRFKFASLTFCSARPRPLAAASCGLRGQPNKARI